MAALVQVNKCAKGQIALVSRNQAFVGQIFRNKWIELKTKGKLFVYSEAICQRPFLFNGMVGVITKPQVGYLWKKAMKVQSVLTKAILQSAKASLVVRNLRKDFQKACEIGNSVAVQTILNSRYRRKIPQELLENCLFSAALKKHFVVVETLLAEVPFFSPIFSSTEFQEK